MTDRDVQFVRGARAGHGHLAVAQRRKHARVVELVGRDEQAFGLQRRGARSRLHNGRSVRTGRSSSAAARPLYTARFMPASSLMTRPSKRVAARRFRVGVWPTTSLVAPNCCNSGNSTSASAASLHSAAPRYQLGPSCESRALVATASKRSTASVNAGSGVPPLAAAFGRQAVFGELRPVVVLVTRLQQLGLLEPPGKIRGSR